MIKRTVKLIIAWFNNFINSILSVIKVLLFSSFAPTCYTITQQSGKHCYILGNGPSLKDVIGNNEIDWDKETNVFVVNDFVLSDNYEIIKPAYYLMADPGYWVADTFLEMIELRNKVFKLINQKTTWNMVFLIPKQAHKTGVFDTEIKNELIKVKFFNTTEIQGFSFLTRFCYKHNLGMPILQNVLSAAIYLAINMRYKEIRILGADHSWLGGIIVNKDNQVCQVNPHFYDGDEVNANVWLKFSGQPYLLHEVLIDLSRMFFAYHQLKSYAAYRNTEVYNLTKGSFIDAFERRF